jgi:hypothetical protein
MLDDADMRIADPIGFLGEIERLPEIVFRRFLLRHHIGEKLHAELHSPLPAGLRRQAG